MDLSCGLTDASSILPQQYFQELGLTYALVFQFKPVIRLLLWSET